MIYVNIPAYGAVGMARGNEDADSGSSQFFLLKWDQVIGWCIVIVIMSHPCTAQCNELFWTELQCNILHCTAPYYTVQYSTVVPICVCVLLDWMQCSQLEYWLHSLACAVDWSIISRLLDFSFSYALPCNYIILFHAFLYFTTTI